MLIAYRLLLNLLLPKAISLRWIGLTNFGRFSILLW
nr:MAG TPA: hypothetical protein [Caudoviricetes sp.]